MPALSVKVRDLKGDGRLWLVVHHARRRWVQLVGRDPEAAEERRREVEAELAAREGDPRSRALPAASILRRWLERERRRLAYSTEQLFEGLIDRHLVPHFGNTDLREIGPGEVRAFVDALLDAGKSPALARQCLGRLSVVCREAVERGQLAQNPVPGARAYLAGVERRRAREAGSVDAWTAEEAARILKIARAREPRFYGPILALFHTGMRRGEVLALRWEDVDWTQRELVVRRALVARRVGTPKSGRARRVPVSPELHALLRREWGRARGIADAPRGWVFRSSEGTPLEPTTLRRAFGRVLSKAASGDPPVRALRLHCARHTWATLALEAGRSVRWVADVLGHADPSFTLRVYAHAVRRRDEDLDFVPGDVVPSDRGTETAPGSQESA